MLHADVHMFQMDADFARAADVILLSKNMVFLLNVELASFSGEKILQFKFGGSLKF